MMQLIQLEVQPSASRVQDALNIQHGCHSIVHGLLDVPGVEHSSLWIVGEPLLARMQLCISCLGLVKSNISKVA